MTDSPRPRRLVTRFAVPCKEAASTGRKTPIPVRNSEDLQALRKTRPRTPKPLGGIADQSLSKKGGLPEFLEHQLKAGLEKLGIAVETETVELAVAVGNC